MGVRRGVERNAKAARPGLFVNILWSTYPSVLLSGGGIEPRNRVHCPTGRKDSNRQLFVTSVDTHNKLTFRTRANDIIDYYFMVASSSAPIDAIIYNYRQLTGTAPLYARWAFGFWRCKEHYHNHTELLNAAAQFRALQKPIDSIVQDWHYWGDLGWGPQW